MATEIPDIRSRSVGEIVDAAIKVWTANFKKLVILAFWVMLPFQILSVGSLYSVRPTLQETLENWQKDVNDATATGAFPELPKFTRAQFGAFAVSTLFTFLAGLVLTAALTSFVSDYIANRGAPDPKSTRRRTLSRSPVVLATSIITLLCAMLPIGLLGLVVGLSGNMGLLAFGLLVVPLTLWIAVRLSATTPVAVLEPVSPIGAIRRSWHLTSGRFWPIFGMTLLGALIVGIPSGILSQVLVLTLKALGGNNPDFAPIWQGIATIAGVVLFQPISSAMSTFLYYDLRVRREGFDMQRLSHDLGKEFPGGPSNPGGPGASHLANPPYGGFRNTDAGQAPFGNPAPPSNQFPPAAPNQYPPAPNQFPPAPNQYPPAPTTPEVQSGNPQPVPPGSESGESGPPEPKWF